MLITLIQVEVVFIQINVLYIYIHMDIGQKPIVIMFFLNQHPLASYPIGYLRVPISATSSKIKLFMLPGVPWQISPDMGE